MPIHTILWMGIIPLFFLISLMVPMFGEFGRKRHLVSIALACVFTVTMALHVITAMGFFSKNLKLDQYDVAGCTYVFEGRFVTDVADSWCLSFSRPLNKHEYKEPTPSDSVDEKPDQVPLANPPELHTGFGAPLWVLLLAVMGAGLLTVSVVIDEIAHSDKWNDPEYLRSADQAIIRHQTFVLFAPLGAIFAYQALIAIGAASNPLTVGIAVLGAGATLPHLLELGVEQSASALKGAAPEQNGPRAD